MGSNPTVSASSSRRLEMRPEPMGDDANRAIPVAPVKLDLGEFKALSVARSDRLRMISTFALLLGLHVLLLALLDPRPEFAPLEEAIPVEVIVEPPAQEALQEPAQEQAKAEDEPVKEPPPENAAKTLDEKPATDYARAADQDKEDGKASEQAAAEKKEPDAKPPQEQAVAQSPEPEAEPQPQPQAQAQAETPQPAPPPVPRFSGMSPLPDLQFKEPLAKRSDLPRGGAEPGYLSTLYGRIMRKMPTMPKQAQPARGRVTFAVLSNGAIFQETIAIPSGSPLLDAAALGAVRRAAPFPAPPQGGPIYIRFDYSSD